MCFIVNVNGIRTRACNCECKMWCDVTSCNVTWCDATACDVCVYVSCVPLPMFCWTKLLTNWSRENYSAERLQNYSAPMHSRAMFSNVLCVPDVRHTENYSIYCGTTPPFLTPAQGFVEQTRSSFHLKMQIYNTIPYIFKLTGNYSVFIAIWRVYARNLWAWGVSETDGRARQETEPTMESSKQTRGGWWHPRVIGHRRAARTTMGQSGAEEDNDTTNQEQEAKLSVNFLTTTDAPSSRQKVTDKTQ